ncbi:MAG: CHRD domain-containing protein [Casimicrobiaceae bacterium]
MKQEFFSKRTLLSLATAGVLGATAMIGVSGTALAVDVKVALKGDDESPPVMTPATGTGLFAIANDNTIAGSVTTKGVAGTAAHIHEGAMGKNGPVIIPLTKAGDTYAVPAGIKLSEAQLAAFKAGNLYVNVHSAAHAGGEIRAQLKP